MTFVAWISERSERDRRSVCRALGLGWSRYQRWQALAKAGVDLDDRHAGGRTLDRPLPDERQAVIDYALTRPTDGYRRLAWQMVDDDIAYLSESAVYRILDDADLLHRWSRSRRGGNKPPKPTAPHERWHTDIMHLRVGDTWYFLVSFIDAYSRYLVHWELLTNMTAREITLAQAEALARHPDAKPEIVTDRGCQYTSKEYHKLMERFELKHILCRVAHPQSNGIIERYHRTTREALESSPPRHYTQALRIIAAWVEEYNDNRLHAGLGYIEPVEYFRGDPERRRAVRREKLNRAAKRRRQTNLAQEEPEKDRDRDSEPELSTAGGSLPTSMETHSRSAAVY